MLLFRVIMLTIYTKKIIKKKQKKTPSDEAALGSALCCGAPNNQPEAD
jgi:hypothetical protein